MRYIFCLLCFFIFYSKAVFSDINRAPLFKYYVNVENNEKYVEILGPFFSYESKPQEKELSLRPIFSYYKNSFFSVDILYPLIRYRQIGTRKHFSIFPLVHTGNDYNEIFLFFWGKTKDGRRYSGVFPFYGRLLKRFAKEEISFFLWPLYTFSKEKDFKTYRVLFPFFTIHKGKRKAFKFLPFFGFDKKEDEFEKYFFLWPIFIYERTQLNTTEPRTYFSIFPLYISERTPLSYSYTFLWPFFRIYQYKNYHYYDFLWPFISWAKGDNFYTLNFLPFFRYEKEKDIKRLYLFYPIYKHQIEYERNKKIITDYFFFINRYERHYDAKGNELLKLFKFWPIYYYKSEQHGKKVYFPAILPVEEAGLERNIAPLLRLYYHKQDKEGNIFTQYFWGIYEHQKNKEKEIYHLFPFFSLERQEKEKRLSFLLGLFQIIKTETNVYFRLFYLFNIGQ